MILICAHKESRNVTWVNLTVANGTGTLIGSEGIVSYGYFVASVTVWFTTPLSFMIVSLTGAHWYIPNLEGLREACHPIVFHPIKLLVAYVSAVIWVYLIIPIGDMAFGFMNLCDHDVYKTEDKRGNLPIDVHAKFPTMLLFEECGEAIPQFVIAVTFYSNNPNLLDFWGVVTMTLSCGSIIKGIFEGCYSCYKSALKAEAEARENTE